MVVPTRVGQVYRYDTTRREQDEYDFPPSHLPANQQQDVYDVPPARQQYNTQVPGDSTVTAETAQHCLLPVSYWLVPHSNLVSPRRTGHLKGR